MWLFGTKFFWTTTSPSHWCWGSQTTCLPMMTVPAVGPINRHVMTSSHPSRSFRLSLSLHSLTSLHSSFFFFVNKRSLLLLHETSLGFDVLLLSHEPGTPFPSPYLTSHENSRPSSWTEGLSVLMRCFTAQWVNCPHLLLDLAKLSEFISY